jgi:hypothetical protein
LVTLATKSIAEHLRVLRLGKAEHHEVGVTASVVWGARTGAPFLVVYRNTLFPGLKNPCLRLHQTWKASCETGTFALGGALSAIAVARLRADLPETSHASMMRAHTRTLL